MSGDAEGLLAWSSLCYMFSCKLDISTTTAAGDPHKQRTSSSYEELLKWCLIFIFTLDKSRDSEVENSTSYTEGEEQWGSHYALKVDKPPLLRKWPLNVLVHLLESTLSTPSQHHSHPLKILRTCAKQSKVV